MSVNTRDTDAQTIAEQLKNTEPPPGTDLKAILSRSCICLWACLLMAVVAVAAVPVSQDMALDGVTFKGQAGEQGKSDHHEETIRFEGGLFRSPRCEKWGFQPAPYTVKKEGEVYHFAVTLPSSERGTLEWKGTITGDAATATFRWLHERWYWDIDRQYWFKGTRVADK